MAFKISGTTVLNNSRTLTNISNRMDWTLKYTDTITLPFQTWTPNDTGSFTVGGDIYNIGVWMCTISWATTETYYYGCTGAFGHDSSSTSSQQIRHFSGTNTNPYCVGGGAYGALCQWRIRGPRNGTSTDNGIDFYWFNRRGLNNTQQTVSATVRSYLLREDHMLFPYSY